MKMLLEAHANTDMSQAMNGDQAVKKIQENMGEFHDFKEGKIREQPKHFDAILLDLNMPIMDGYDACVQIQDIYKRFN